MPLRDAVEEDIPEILGIYNDVIATSTAVYTEKPVALDERLAWFRRAGNKAIPFSSPPATAESPVSSLLASSGLGRATSIP